MTGKDSKNNESNRLRGEIVKQVQEVYRWIDEQLDGKGGKCSQCGRCCDFVSYDHRLYVTSPEMIYFVEKIGRENIRKMTGGVCPYSVSGLCTVHALRFAACRIFFCGGDLTEDRQGELSEEAIEKFKDICRRYDIPYSYCNIGAALNRQYTES